jgi:hypothetical protein
MVHLINSLVHLLVVLDVLLHQLKGQLLLVPYSVYDFDLILVGESLLVGLFNHESLDGISRSKPD